MCTVIVGFRCFADTPLVVAANRDELLDRPSDQPLLLRDDPPRWGGRDQIAGGTWLAVDPNGRVGAVTNRHPGGVYLPPDRSRRSRGDLPIEVLDYDDASVEPWMMRLRPADYNAVNLLYLSAEVALWVGLDDQAGRRVRRLEPGVHVITEQDPDDPADAKALRILGQARDAHAASADGDGLVLRWGELLRSHESGDAGSPACIHAEQHGTVSSTTVVVSREGVRYEHAEGPPCITPFRRVV
jgi:uncharacterized protein with NRDE domain